jgi:pantoate kinase
MSTKSITTADIMRYQQRKREKKDGSIGLGVWLDKQFNEHSVNEPENLSEGRLKDVTIIEQH